MRPVHFPCSQTLRWLLLGTLGLLGACTPPAPNPLPAATTTAPPNLSGVWMAFAAVAPDGGFAPKYSAEGQATLDAFSSQFKQIPETGAFCVPGGMPSVMLATVSYPIEIVQTENRLVMLAELEMQVRRVFLDGREHPRTICRLASAIQWVAGTAISWSSIRRCSRSGS